MTEAFLSYKKAMGCSRRVWRYLKQGQNCAILTIGMQASQTMILALFNNPKIQGAETDHGIILEDGTEVRVFTLSTENTIRPLLGKDAKIFYASEGDPETEIACKT